MSFFLANLNYW